MLYFDPLYLAMVGPALLLAIWAQFQVKSTFNRFKQYGLASGKTAAMIAREILDRAGLSFVRVEQVSGNLTDHYDPSSKVLRLSDEVYSSSSIAAVGVAAHEAGHAIQDAQNYGLLRLRNSLVPGLNLTSWAAFPLIIIGFIFHSTFMIHLGIIFFSGVVFFQLITLPVEFDASSRALRILKAGYFNHQEYLGAKKVLNAAALTYVASALSSVLQLLYFLVRAGILGGSDD